jgi:hypothetical protein
MIPKVRIAQTHPAGEIGSIPLPTEAEVPFCAMKSVDTSYTLPPLEGLLLHLRDSARTEREKGTYFENLVRAYFGYDIYGHLGRSLFAGDPYLSGSIDELRIYDVALSQAQVAYSDAQGKDTSLFE